jgi:hypothetical protein
MIFPDRAGKKHIHCERSVVPEFKIKKGGWLKEGKETIHRYEN